MPLARWLPPGLRDAVYERLDVGDWVRGSLRLVGARELARLAGAAGWPRATVIRQRLLCLTSVLVVWARLPEEGG